jgi:hypothetical protein
MREPKLRDFLVYYMEIDLWAHYKDKEIASLKGEVDEFTRAQELALILAYKQYKSLQTYFMQPDVRSFYLKLKPVDEAELVEVNKLHSYFISSWPKDIRGERAFVDMHITNWVEHRRLLREWIKSKKRRLDAMAPDHVKRPAEAAELALKERATLPMVEQELDKLRAFHDTYDRIEKRKLEWYWAKKKDPNYQLSEAEYLVHYVPDHPVNVKDLALWKAQEYRASLEKKNQFELLEEAYQRFKNEPKRYPYWLQYMVVHFSGMRYASAHGSWADPRDLLIQLRQAEVAKESGKVIDDVEVERQCREKIAAYESGSGPKLAKATEKEWKDKVAMHMLSVKANGPKTRRAGLTALKAEEINYEYMSMTTDEALKKLDAMQDTFPTWAWKQIIKLTPLRITHVTDPDWEKLTPEEETVRNAYESTDLRNIMDAWINKHIGAWRDEHGRTHELIVSRAVCNETAEHAQHIRGHLPPGGLTPKPKWYLDNEKENKLPGAYYTKPTSEKDYTQGASIFWLRFVDKEPSAWQVAKPVATKDGESLLSEDLLAKKLKNSSETPWTYKPGDVTTRSRSFTDANQKKVNEQQWLRWIHEATVAEVAETAEGTMVITYETALPDGDKGTSAVGIFKMPLFWHLSDGTEDAYNRSFVGYLPEGQVPMEHLKTMLDWNKILRKQAV